MKIIRIILNIVTILLIISLFVIAYIAIFRIENDMLFLLAFGFASIVLTILNSNLKK